MVDNAEWLDRLEYIPFLRDVGRHFSVNRMLTMDSVKLRLDRDAPLSFLEFNYMILQAYDFVELYKRYGCRLQAGGSDQWGNIVAGDRSRAPPCRCGIVRRHLAADHHLIGREDGKDRGRRGLAERRSMLALRILAILAQHRGRRCRALPAALHRIARTRDRAARDASKGAERNEAKKILATEATALCHGREAAEQAAETARRTFEEGAAAAGLPSFGIERARLAAGVPVATLAHLAGLTSSASEARRFIQGGGLRVNDAPVGDVRATASLDDLNSEGVIKLSVGKKQHILIKPV